MLFRRVFAGFLLVLPVISGQTVRSFDRVVLLEEKGETSAGVHLGDLNGDGQLDIVLAKGRHWPLHDRVLLNDGKGGFTASNLGVTPDRTYSAALADLDLDGDLDIVVSNDAPDRKHAVDEVPADAVAETPDAPEEKTVIAVEPAAAIAVEAGPAPQGE